MCLYPYRYSLTTEHIDSSGRKNHNEFFAILNYADEKSKYSVNKTLSMSKLWKDILYAVFMNECSRNIKIGLLA